MRSRVHHLVAGMMGGIGLCRTEEEPSEGTKELIRIMVERTPDPVQPWLELARPDKGKGARKRNKANRWRGPQGALR